jgi:GNAT acetyltransferase
MKRAVALCYGSFSLRDVSCSNFPGAAMTNMTNMNERDFLRLHLEAVWEIALPPLIGATVELRANAPLPPWLVYQARLVGSQQPVTLWRPDASPEQRDDLLRRHARANVADDESPKLRREVALSVGAIPSSLRLRDGASARLLAAEDAPLLETFEAGSSTYYLDARRAPCIGVLVDGRLVSVAHSSRRTLEACELGINTLPDMRRRGYATGATVAWTAAIQREGLIPIYSARADNTASLRVAAAAGYAPFCEGIYGPENGTGE